MTVNIKWKDLEYKLSKPILDAMANDFKFDKVTAVQNSVIPVFSKNYDVAVEVLQIYSRPALDQEKLLLFSYRSLRSC